MSFKSDFKAVACAGGVMIACAGAMTCNEIIEADTPQARSSHNNSGLLDDSTEFVIGLILLPAAALGSTLLYMSGGRKRRNTPGPRR